jgi:hypothetical protein
MIVRTEAIAQADSVSLDCWVQLSLPQVALCWLRVDCFDFRGKLVFVVCGAIEFKNTIAVETASVLTKPTQECVEEYAVKIILFPSVSRCADESLTLERFQPPFNLAYV